jgi:hypothetical protein
MPLSLATVASGGHDNGCEPMIALEPGGMAPILSYNVPDAVSYSGKSFIALQFPDWYFQHGIGLPEGGQPSGENIQPAGAGRILSTVDAESVGVLRSYRERALPEKRVRRGPALRRPTYQIAGSLSALPYPSVAAAAAAPPLARERHNGDRWPRGCLPAGRTCGRVGESSRDASHCGIPAADHTSPASASCRRSPIGRCLLISA